MSRQRYLTSDELLQATEGPTTLRRQARIEAVAARRQRGLMVLMEDVYNPHNLAAIARSCDAFGVQDIAFTVADADDFDIHEAGKYTSSGASKWLDYRTFADGTAACLRTLKGEGWHVMATVLADDALSLYDVDFTAPHLEKLVVMVGNEKDGISPIGAEMADSRMVIPMQGMIQSFNVSVATALTLAEITRQRRASPRRYTLSDEDAARLARDFALR